MNASRFAMAAGLLLGIAPSLHPQGPPAVTVGFRDSLSSKVLHEERKLQIFLPDGYNATTARYPVVYLLDGDAHFLHAAGLIQFLVREARIPPLILVAIGNTDRVRDFTPETRADSAGQFPTAGGAQDFLQFLREELFPHVEQQYRTVPFRVLVGHSLGGLLAVEALESHPEMFRGYVVISPSLWWDAESPAERADSALRVHPDLRGWVYLTVGNESREMVGGAERLAAALSEAAPEGLAWRYDPLPGETHGTIVHRAVYDGLEFVFGEMRVGRERLAQIVEQGLPRLDAYYRELSERYGYPIAVPEAFINQLGFIYLRAGRTAEAIEVFRENIRRFPGSANTYDSLGDAYAAAGMFPEAAESYRDALRLGWLTSDPVVPYSAAKLKDAESRLAPSARGD
jgi:predicted alpha/beta superfamily hydrolase